MKLAFATAMISLLSTGSVVAETTNPTAWQTQVFNEITAVYKPLAESTQNEFRLVVLKDSPSESAAAEFDGKIMKVTVNGGLLKNQSLTEDGLRTILCHELGHIFGGAPRRDAPMEWDGPTDANGKLLASSEGQADYYATTVCFRKVAKDEGEQKFAQFLATTTIHPHLQTACTKAFGLKSAGMRLCIRGALGGENMLQLARRFPLRFDLLSPASTTGDITNAYPERQCRLETFIAGALCAKALPLSMDGLNAAANTCKTPSTSRPACWYPSDQARP